MKQFRKVQVSHQPKSGRVLNKRSMVLNRRAIICIRLKHIHYGINGIVRLKNDACVREYVYIKILCPVAKSPDRHIWETDCTQERTCNEYGPVATNKERT